MIEVECPYGCGEKVAERYLFDQHLLISGKGVFEQIKDRERKQTLCPEQKVCCNICKSIIPMKSIKAHECYFSLCDMVKNQKLDARLLKNNIENDYLKKTMENFMGG